MKVRVSRAADGLRAVRKYVFQAEHIHFKVLFSKGNIGGERDAGKTAAAQRQKLYNYFVIKKKAVYLHAQKAAKQYLFTHKLLGGQSHS